MRRSALLIAVLCLLCPAPGLDADAHNCIPKKSCQAPPCELVAELKFVMAKERALRRSGIPASSITQEAYQRLVKTYDADLRKNWGAYYTCAAPDTSMDSYIVGDVPKCEIGVRDAAGNFQPRSLDDALKASKGCSESVQAAYEELIRRSCR